jgi:hypothetical protein
LFLPLTINVRSTACHAIQLQFNISANTVEKRAVQSPKCIVWCAVNCTFTVIFWSPRKSKVWNNYNTAVIIQIWITKLLTIHQPVKPRDRHNYVEEDVKPFSTTFPCFIHKHFFPIWPRSALLVTWHLNWTA